MKTIVITGASRGIGLAAAKKFLKNGWRVIGTSTKGDIPIDSKNLTAVQLDLFAPESIAEATEKILKISPNIDVIVNSAGIILDAHDCVVDMGKIRKTLEVNLIGAINFTENLIPFIQSNGHIINIDSAYGALSSPIDDETSTAYRISKAGLNMYTRTLAYRLKNKDIVVSSVDPGWVKTDMGNAGATETEGPDREPEEVADDICNIVSDVKESGCFWRFGEKRDW